MPHRERHRSERIGWLRAAVLGANDGIVSTASLVVGGAPMLVGAARVTVWGVVAMLTTAAVGRLFGTLVG
jgi:VIT1/CCC1 family predicted Fe2+/Mn2+ transporter